jgi:hypothetical protein
MLLVAKDLYINLGHLLIDILLLEYNYVIAQV